MLFRQFFDAESSTYTYLLAAAPGREALMPVPGAGRRAVRLRRSIDPGHGVPDEPASRRLDHA
jgi:hypothetical protein